LQDALGVARVSSPPVGPMGVRTGLTVLVFLDITAGVRFLLVGPLVRIRFVSLRRRLV
jgi:hypothetical protein